MNRWEIPMSYFHTVRFFFYLGVILFFFSSCSDNSVDPDGNEPDDEISGSYHLEGYQVNLELCYASDCGGDEILSRDTVLSSFTVEIEAVKNRPDSLLFSNLPGADVAINHPNYSGHAADEDCNSSSLPDYCAYASFKNDTLRFDIITQPGEYIGLGTLKNGHLTLQTHFRHRGAGVDYFLSGMKEEN